MFDIERQAPLVRSQMLSCYPAHSLKALEDIRSKAITQRTGFDLDAEIITRKGSRRWIRITATVECSNNRPVRLFGMKQDITDEKARWDRLRRRAEVDELTGLANRSLFQAKLSEICAIPAATQAAGALILIDLDGFKAVNDSIGHRAGDACLAEAGRRLSRACPDAVLVARNGGDEFAVLLGPAANADRVSAIASHIVRTMSRPVCTHGHSFVVSASVGVAPIDGCSASELFERADAALYAAKGGGKNTYRWYEPGAPCSLRRRTRN
jgi:diguanylate cyclase (GGDEF)-like protein